MMKKNQELFERIEQYLENKLSKEDRISFEKEIDENPELKTELWKHREMQQALEDMDALDFRKKIQKIEAEIHRPAKTNRFLSPFLKIAASVIILVGISTLVWVQFYGDTDLFKEYYKPYPIEETVRGGVGDFINDTLESAPIGSKTQEKKNFPIQEILKLYSDGNYIKALPYLKQLVEKYPDQESFKIYLGNCFINTNNELLALPIFQKFSAESYFYEAAQWYLALTYLRLENVEKTQNTLIQIIDYQGIYKENASKLLMELQTL